MTDSKIKAAIAPCGLNCEKCFAHVDGKIRHHSLLLKNALGNFDVYAKRFETMLPEPVFQNYPKFKAMLEYFASENCQGCRKEQCNIFKDCGVRACHQEKEFDFCHQCDDFPCGKTNFDKHLYDRWVILNEKIREKGIERFYQKSMDAPRYP